MAEKYQYLVLFLVIIVFFFFLREQGAIVVVIVPYSIEVKHPRIYLIRRTYLIRITFWVEDCSSRVEYFPGVFKAPSPGDQKRTYCYTLLGHEVWGVVSLPCPLS